MLYAKIGFVAALAQGAAAIAIKGDQCVDDDAGFTAAFENLGVEDDDDGDDVGIGQGCLYPETLLQALDECTVEAYEAVAGEITDDFERQIQEALFCYSRQYCPVTCAAGTGAPANALELYCAEDCSGGNDDGQCVDDPINYLVAVNDLYAEYEDRIPNDDDGDDDDDAGDDDDIGNPCLSLINSFDTPATACTLEAAEAADGAIADPVEREFADKVMCATRQYCPVTCAGLSGAPSNGLEQYCAEDCSGAANMHVGMVPVMVVGLAALKNLVGA